MKNNLNRELERFFEDITLTRHLPSELLEKPNNTSSINIEFDDSLFNDLNTDQGNRTPASKEAKFGKSNAVPHDASSSYKTEKKSEEIKNFVEQVQKKAGTTSFRKNADSIDVGLANKDKPVNVEESDESLSDESIDLEADDNLEPEQVEMEQEDVVEELESNGSEHDSVQNDNAVESELPQDDSSFHESEDSSGEPEEDVPPKAESLPEKRARKESLKEPEYDSDDFGDGRGEFEDDVTGSDDFISDEDEEEEAFETVKAPHVTQEESEDLDLDYNSTFTKKQQQPVDLEQLPTKTQKMDVEMSQFGPHVVRKRVAKPKRKVNDREKMQLELLTVGALQENEQIKTSLFYKTFEKRIKQILWKVCGEICKDETTGSSSNIMAENVHFGDAIACMVGQKIHNNLKQKKCHTTTLQGLCWMYNTIVFKEEENKKGNKQGDVKYVITFTDKINPSDYEKAEAAIERCANHIAQEHVLLESKSIRESVTLRGCDEATAIYIRRCNIVCRPEAWIEDLLRTSIQQQLEISALRKLTRAQFYRSVNPIEVVKMQFIDWHNNAVVSKLLIDYKQSNQ